MGRGLFFALFASCFLFVFFGGGCVLVFFFFVPPPGFNWLQLKEAYSKSTRTVSRFHHEVHSEAIQGKKAKVNSRPNDFKWVWQVIQWSALSEQPRTIGSGSSLSILIETRTGTRRINEANHIRLHPDDINKDSGFEIPEAWKFMIKQHNINSVPLQTTEGTISTLNDKDRLVHVPTLTYDRVGTCEINAMCGITTQFVEHRTGVAFDDHSSLSLFFLRSRLFFSLLCNSFSAVVNLQWNLTV